MRWSRSALGLLAGAALVAAVGACGSIIPVPDQGIIVTGCSLPAACFTNICSCLRADANAAAGAPGSCTVPPVCSNPSDNSTCNCPTSFVTDGGVTASSQCIERAQACVGRGVFCGGANAICVPAGSACSQSTPGAAPPMLLPTGGTSADGGAPMLEPHCQFVDDVCCPGADGGVTTD